VKRALAVVAVLLALLAATALPRPQRPHVVVILIDTLRRDHLPFYGYAKETAPFLTSLAERGVVFEHAYSTSSWTPPAAASLFTSLYPFQHGVLRGFQLAQRIERLTGVKLELSPVPPAAETQAEALSRAGYRTFAITENPNLVAEMGFAQGFTSFSSHPKDLDADVILAALDAIAPELAKPSPYFLYLHFMDVHGPYRGRAPLYDASLPDESARRVSAYDSGIRYLDERLARAFARFGWAQNALVVVTADHGEELGDRGEWGHGATLFSEVMNVPLVIHPPGGGAGRRVAYPASLVDVLPTLRMALRLPPGLRDEGVSLWPFVDGRRPAPPPRTLYAHLWRGDRKDGSERALKAAIADGWKWIGGDPEGARLFDLARDPGERTNLATAEPERLAQLRDRYRAFEAASRKYTASRRSLELDADALENLKALGYVN
jgi:arylsulfatase A-like enzyme